MLKQDINQYLVFPFILKKDYVKLGQKAVVKEGSVLAFCARGKVLDILPEGNHVLVPSLLPRANKRFGLSKVDKNGLSPDGFSGYAYFVSLEPVQNVVFETYKKLRYKNNLDGKFWVKMQFCCDVRISDPELFLKSLLKQLAYLRPNEPEEVFSTWLSEFATDNLQKFTFRKSEFAKPKVYDLADFIGAGLEPQLQNLGVELLNVGVLEVELGGAGREPKNPLYKNISKNEALRPSEEVYEEEPLIKEDLGQIAPSKSSEYAKNQPYEKVPEENFEEEFEEFEDFTLPEEDTSWLDAPESEETWSNDVPNFDTLGEIQYKKDTSYQLHAEACEHITSAEDENMTEFVDPHARIEAEANWEELENRSQELDEKMAKKNVSKDSIWSGWESFLDKD